VSPWKVSTILKNFGVNKCECGCGLLAPLDKRGKVQRFRLGHNVRGPNLVGRTFGFTVVLREGARVGKSKAWICRCKCGVEYIVRATNLLQGRHKGCRTCTNGNLGAPFAYLYRQLLAQCRNHEVSLTYEDYLEFTKQSQCHYCEENIIWRPHGDQKSGYKLDRKDNNLGYTKNNCVVCCPRCNWAKSDHFTYDEWLQIGRLIATWRKQ